LSWRGDRIASVAACAAALAFHMSAIVIISLVLIIQLHNRFVQFLSLKKAIAVSMLVFITTLFSAQFVVNYLQDIILVLSSYQEVEFKAINPLAPTLLLDWGMIIAGLLMWSRLPAMMRYVLLFQLSGMAIFYASMDLPVIAHRIREFFSVFWVFYIVQGLHQKTPVKVVSILFVIVSIALYSYLFFFSGKFFL
jgi:hypothetical protein